MSPPIFATIARTFLSIWAFGSFWLMAPGTVLAGNIYDAQIMKYITFAPSQVAKVREVLNRSDREIAVIFAKYGIDPNARPVFGKLRKASGELQALERREKRQMKRIMSAEQYKRYLQLLEITAARVIKATRRKP